MNFFISAALIINRSATTEAIEALSALSTVSNSRCVYCHCDCRRHCHNDDDND